MKTHTTMMVFMFIALGLAFLAFCLFGYHPWASLLVGAFAIVPAYISSVLDRLDGDDDKRY